ITDEFIDQFENAKIIILKQNYRSTKKILNIANSLINNNPNRIKKNLFTDSSFNSEVIYFEADDQDNESKFVCSKIKELVDQKQYQYKDIAILYRANYLSRNIEELLSYNYIPYRIFGGFRFYQRKEVKDMIAYMRLVSNSDEMSLTRIYNIPKRQISEKTFFAIKNYAVTNNLSTFASFGKVEEIKELSAKAKNACLEFYNLITEIRNKKFDSISQLIDEIAEKTNYFQMLKDEGEENRIDNINELKNAAIAFEKNNPNNANLHHYLQELAILTSVDETNDKNDKNINTVSLMTVHSAKGLEFDIVFIIQMNENIFPSIKSIEEGNLDEERRIAYVAITRAKKNLYLSCSKGANYFGNVSGQKTPSRFLLEIDDLLADKRIVSKNTSSTSKKVFEPSRNQKSSIDLDNVYHDKKEEYYIG
ncbi:MAG: ATP-binding domain-containing protein, partial [Malacoplasma sp.]|nr:ATP-binding domain-containing protein [Malacoplasma sp.]